MSFSPNLRPLNITHDLPAVADLVERCFSSTMDADGRNFITQMRRAGHDSTFLRWAGRAVESVTLPLMGYVWIENEELIGNVSLIPYHQAKRKYFLIANVAVSPEHRRKGIGKELTLAALNHARERHANETWLHVRDDNPGAIGLYLSLGFAERARRTSWEACPSAGKFIPTTGNAITRRSAADWQVQEKWLEQCYPGELGWYLPVPRKFLSPGLTSFLNRFISDMEVRQWVLRVDDLPVAFSSLQMVIGQNSRLWLAVPGNIGDRQVGEMLQCIIHMPHQSSKIVLDFPAGNLDNGIEQAGFKKLRTLLWMKFDETFSG